MSFAEKRLPKDRKETITVIFWSLFLHIEQGKKANAIPAETKPKGLIKPNSPCNSTLSEFSNKKISNTVTDVAESGDPDGI